MSVYPVEKDPRPILVGNAQPMGVDVDRRMRCEHCDRMEVHINKYQQAWAYKAMQDYEGHPVTLGGRIRPSVGLFCWECARTLGIKTQGQPQTRSIA